MVTKKKIIENELMKEIVSIRVDALWKMLSQKKDGLFTEPYEEGATGKLDNKGAIFIHRLKLENVHRSILSILYHQKKILA
jgi:hypothetical protein